MTPDKSGVNHDSGVSDAICAAVAAVWVWGWEAVVCAAVVGGGVMRLRGAYGRSVGDAPTAWVLSSSGYFVARRGVPTEGSERPYDAVASWCGDREPVLRGCCV